MRMDGDGVSADDEDLADQLDLETTGINHEKKEKNKLSKRNLQQLATTMKVQIDLPGASPVGPHICDRDRKVLQNRAHLREY